MIHIPDIGIEVDPLAGFIVNGEPYVSELAPAVAIAVEILATGKPGGFEIREISLGLIENGVFPDVPVVPAVPVIPRLKFRNSDVGPVTLMIGNYGTEHAAPFLGESGVVPARPVSAGQLVRPVLQQDTSGFRFSCLF